MLCLGIEQGVLDRADRLRHHAAGGRARRGIELGVDAFVLAGVLADDGRSQPLDRRRHAG